MKLQWWLRALLYSCAALLLLEGLLRFGLGFGSIPVYHSSPAYEYGLSPNQHLTRFGKQFMVNEAGMRSLPLGHEEFRILKFGDSVLNGGVSTDHDALASSILEGRLAATFPEKGLRVLNLSAGSWGPDNAFAWMQTHSDYSACAIVLLFSSHDWQDQMSFQDIVGNVPFYPASQPAWAIGDAASWLLSRHFTKVDWESLPLIPGAIPKPKAHNSGWDDFATYADTTGIPLLVYHHPTRSEWEQGAFTANGLALQAWLSQHDIKTINGLAAGYTAQAYRDDIHPNDLGQRIIADALEPYLQDIIEAYEY